MEELQYRIWELQNTWREEDINNTASVSDKTMYNTWLFIRTLLHGVNYFAPKESWTWA